MDDPNAVEELHPYMPEPKMNAMSITAIYDASHVHCLVMRPSVTVITLMVKSMVLRCTSKRQYIVESATYGAEMVAARLAVDQFIDLRYKLRMLGVTLKGPTTLLGDNTTIITSCSIPSSNLKKKHNTIPVAAGIIVMKYVKSSQNLANA